MEMNLEDLLGNQSIAEIEDLPELLDLPTGTWHLKGKSAKADTSSNEKPVMKLTCEVVAATGDQGKHEDGTVMSVEEVNEAYPAGNSAFYGIYGTDAGQIMSKLKGIAGDAASELGCETLGEFIGQFDQLEFLASIKRRLKDKNDPDEGYWNEIVYIQLIS